MEFRMTAMQRPTALSIVDVDAEDDRPKGESVYLLIMGAFLLTAFAAIFSFIKILARFI
jgi:hypothetical protein